MARSKIEDEGEVQRWYEEGRTYQWMVDEYLRKYNIETTPSMFGNLRGRRGWERRTTRDQELIPWYIEPQHRNSYDLALLRMEARRRRGIVLPQKDLGRLDGWLARLKRDNVVLHYEPDTEDGFFYVPPRPGVDIDIIRKPAQVTSKNALD